MTAPDLTCDAFLGGRLSLQQPRRGYRAGVDSVLLAASIPALPGQSVLELGCGAGAAILCLGARVPGLRLTGLELQQDYCDLARQNADRAGIALEVVTGDLAQMPASVKERRFDHVIANPPYFKRSDSVAATDPGREAALGEGVPLSAWIRAAAKRCAPGGHVSVIHRAARLPELLAAMMQRLGSIEVLPLAPRAGRPASLVLIRARMNGRAEFRLHDAQVMHAGDVHSGDAENYTKPISCALRDGAALTFGKSVNRSVQ